MWVQVPPSAPAKPAQAGFLFHLLLENCDYDFLLSLNSFLYNSDMNIKSQFSFTIKNTLQVLVAWAVVVFAALIVLQQANPALNKLGRDAGAFMYIGSRILHGDAPYLAAWDSKPPGTFLVSAAGLWIGRGTRWGVWIIEFTLLSIAAILGYTALRKQFGVGVALFSSVIWLYGLNSLLIGGNMTEEYSLFFGFVAVFLLFFSLGCSKTAWIDFGIGICAGSSFLFRPNNIGAQISIALTIMILMIAKKQYLSLFKRFVLIGLGALLPLIAITIYLISKGALQAFWEASFLYNFSYAGGDRFNPISAFSSGLSQLGIPAGIALLGWLIALPVIINQFKRQEEITPVYLWVVVAGVVEVLLSGLSGRNYEHYFINWLPFVALSSSVLIAHTYPGFVEWTRKRSLEFVLLFALVFLSYFNDVPGLFWQSVQPLLFDRSKPVQSVDLVAEYVNINSTSGDTVLVWGGQAGINFLSQRDSPTRYLFYPLYVPSDMTDKMSTDFYNTLLANPPALIVDGATYDPNQLIPLSTASPLLWLQEHNIYNTPYLMETLAFVRKNYVLVDTVNGVDIYRRK